MGGAAHQEGPAKHVPKRRHDPLGHACHSLMAPGMQKTQGERKVA